MNDMEKKMAQKGKERQAALTPEEKDGIDKLVAKLAKEVKDAQAKVLAEKGNGKVKKTKNSKALIEPAKQNGKKEGKQAPKSTSKAVKPTTKTDKKAPATPKQELPAGTLTTKEVAAMVGVTPKALRRTLRAKWYNDGVTTNYRWTKSDPILKEIVAHYKQLAAK